MQVETFFPVAAVAVADEEIAFGHFAAGGVSGGFWYR
jgi:hypothetical protein